MYELHRKATLGDLADAMARLQQSQAEPDLIALGIECLAPDRLDRPRHAGIVTTRITAYLAGVQERLRAAEIARATQEARAEEAEAKARAERRARKLTLALTVSVASLFVAVGGGWTYFQRIQAARRTATEQAVVQALDQATLLWGQARSAAIGDLTAWAAALSAARQAQGVLAAGDAGADVKNRVRFVLASLEREQAEAQLKADELRRDRELLARLETIRGARSLDRSAKTDGDYAAAFREFGIDFARLDAAEIGRLIRARSTPAELAAFLDDWAYLRFSLPPERDGGFARKLIAAARAADPEPWRDSLRKQIRGNDKTALPRLADDMNALDGQPATSLLLLGRGLMDLRESARAERILLRAWKLQPDDFWVNNQLGELYYWYSRPAMKPNFAARYYAAAVAIRPRSFSAHMNLGVALGPVHLDESVSQLRQALLLEPKSVATHINLAVQLKEQRKLGEMTSEYREAVRLDPKSLLAHEGLALGLYLEGKRAEAVAEWRELIRLDPQGATSRLNLGYAIAIEPDKTPRDYEEALGLLRKAVELEPKSGAALNDLGLALYRLNRFDEAIAECKRGIELDKNGKAEASFFLAMAHWKKNEKDLAQKYFNEAVPLSRPQIAYDPTLRQIWAEAAKLLNQPGPDDVAPSKVPPAAK